jgi:hypothetical protein
VGTINILFCTIIRGYTLVEKIVFLKRVLFKEAITDFHCHRCKFLVGFFGEIAILRVGVAGTLRVTFEDKCVGEQYLPIGLFFFGAVFCRFR